MLTYYTDGRTSEGRNNNFTKEAREELITYFVFGTGPEEPTTEAGAGKEENRQKQQERGNAASSDELQVSRTSSKRWRRDGQRSSSGGDDADAVRGAGVSDGGGIRNGRIGANNADTGGSFSANSPVPSTGPCSPAPSGEEVGDGDAAPAATVGGAALAASPGHATTAITAAASPSGLELPRANGEGETKEGGLDVFVALKSCDRGGYELSCHLSLCCLSSILSRLQEDFSPRTSESCAHRTPQEQAKTKTRVRTKTMRTES